MSSLLIAFLIVLVLPLLMSSWRISLTGLACQGLLMGWMVLDEAAAPSAATIVLLVDLFLVRGLWVPRYLHAIQRARRAPGRNDVIPANLLSWTVAGSLVVIAFHFASVVASDDIAQENLVATATAALLLGFLVLSTQTSPFSQIIGVLRIENAIVLFELGAESHLPLPVQVSVAVVFVLTMLTFGRFLRRLDTAAVAAAPPAQGPTL